MVLTPIEEQPERLHNRFGIDMLLQRFQIFNFALDDVTFVMLVLQIYITVMLMHAVMQVWKNILKNVLLRKQNYVLLYHF